MSKQLDFEKLKAKVIAETDYDDLKITEMIVETVITMDNMVNVEGAMFVVANNLGVDISKAYDKALVDHATEQKVEIIDKTAVGPKDDPTVIMATEQKEVCAQCGAYVGTRHLRSCVSWFSIDPKSDNIVTSGIIKTPVGQNDPVELTTSIKTMSQSLEERRANCPYKGNPRHHIGNCSNCKEPVKPAEEDISKMVGFEDNISSVAEPEAKGIDFTALKSETDQRFQVGGSMYLSDGSIEQPYRTVLSEIKKNISHNSLKAIAKRALKHTVEMHVYGTEKDVEEFLTHAVMIGDLYQPKSGYYQFPDDIVTEPKEPIDEEKLAQDFSAFRM